MPSDQRRDVATATVGAGGLAAGGVLRHRGVKRLKEEPRVHALGILRNGDKRAKRLFGAGSALGLVATVPTGVGVSRLARPGDVEKKAAEERKPSFLGEGLRGTASALRGRGENALQPVPAEVRGTQLGVAAGAGLGGSALARAAMKRRSGGVKAAVSPIAGTLAAVGTVPVTNRAIKDRGYQVTPYGVKRSKTAAVKPSSRATVDRQLPRSFRQDVGKADDYLAQRGAITAAGGAPVVGPLAAAAAAGRYAPPGQEKKHAARQYLMGSVAGVPAGVAGAYAGARAAEKSPAFHDKADQALKLKSQAETKVRSFAGLGEKKPAAADSWRGRNVAPRVARLKASRAGAPLFSSPKRAIGATAGFLGTKAAVGTVGSQSAISLNQHDQRKYKAGVAKKANPKTTDDLNRSQREKHALAQKKRMSAALSYGGGALGVTGTALLLAGKKGPATTAGLYGGGLGGANALITGGVQRKEAKTVDPLAVKKRDRLEIQGTPDEHKRLVSRYGDRGPLPKGLDRPTKMKAYEARYVAHGGDKADKYGRRADAAEGVRNAGLAGATVGGAAWLAARTRAGSKVAGKVTPKIRRKADTVAVGSATAGGAAELYAEHARGRRASYTNSPAGVAGSALRRMRDYTPE